MFDDWQSSQTCTVTLWLVTPQPTDDEAPAKAWMDDVERICDGPDGPTIISKDGTVVHYEVPTQAELDAAPPSA